MSEYLTEGSSIPETYDLAPVISAYIASEREKNEQSCKAQEDPSFMGRRYKKSKVLIMTEQLVDYARDMPNAPLRLYPHNVTAIIKATKCYKAWEMSREDIDYKPLPSFTYRGKPIQIISEA